MGLANRPELGSAARADEVHRAAIVIDGTFNAVFARPLFERMREGGYTAAVVSLGMPFQEASRTLQVLREVSEWQALLEENADLICLVRQAADITEAKAAGKVGIIFGMQDGSAFAEEMKLLRVYHSLGLRIASLAYNTRSLLADGCHEPADAGLSRLGRVAVEELAAVGILLDLSHMGERSALEALTIYPGSAVLTHSNPRALCDNSRNVSDELIEAVAAKGGVIGVTALPMLLTRKSEKPERSVDDILDHIDYVVARVGVEHVSFASDFFRYTLNDAIELNFASSFLGRLRREPIRSEADFDPETFELIHPRGLRQVQELPNLTAGLLARGYSPEDARRILGANLMRVFERVW